MKRILFFAFAFAMTVLSASGQDNPVYVVFTPTTGDTQGIRSSTNNDYNRDLYRSPTKRFTVFSRPAGYFFRFVYQNRKSEPDNSILLKPANFLDTVEYIDWDAIGPTLTKEQAELKIAEILTHSEIYFIERPLTSTHVWENPNFSLPVVPVGLLRSRF